MKETLIAKLMGLKVIVSQVYERCLSENIERPRQKRADWKLKPHDRRVGWIVGCIRLQNGEINRRTGYTDDDNYDEGYLKIDSITPALKVVFWPTMKPVFIPIAAPEWAGGFKPLSPSAWSWKHTSVEAKLGFENTMLDEMRDWPRDTKGHWVRRVGTAAEARRIEAEQKAGES